MDKAPAETTAATEAQVSVTKVEVTYLFILYSLNINSYLLESHVLLAFTSEIQFSNLQESLPKEIKKSVESTPLKTGTKPENSTSSIQKSVVKDAGPVSATVCPQRLDTSVPVTTDPAVQLNIPTKIISKETEEMLKDIKQAEATEKPKGVTQNNTLKPEQIGASTVKPGLVSKDMDIVDMGTESDLQKMLEESKSKPIEKETVRQTAVSEDQKRAVSFLDTVPILDTNTTPQEDTALVH